ncbi:NifU family protein [Streptomyces sp. A3M-1-3]|uniref:NifU family protein n=1 Tax=Streptomyces sp. A3M-1-3 TaxID=2962044 RepID=UPI0020B68C67|nr:NifU family protein [Streptomyces sp. A3M-1-3]MCP3819778.1 NifU family protein [Streptomyces sp. A3M-1-3]
MSAVNAEQAGRRVEEVLDRLAATGDQAVCAAAEELVRVLMDFYGAGLARIVSLLDGPASKSPTDGRLAGLLGDELVAGLLVLHDLHPEDTDTRIARALESVRDLALEVAGFDDTTATLRLRSASGAGCGCPSTGAASQQAVEDALACFAPEVKTVELEPTAAPREPALLQIGAGPRTGPQTGPRTGAAPEPAPAKAP